MCGIFGGRLFSLDGGSQEVFHSLMSELQMASGVRGRNGAGVCWSITGDVEGVYDTRKFRKLTIPKGVRVVIGASRATPLPEVDSSAGVVQPLRVEDCGRFLWLVHNGTISNDRELAKEWGVDIEVDSEILGYALLRARRQELVGGIAFLAYDQHRDRLVVGKNFKTLWWYSDPRFVAFASEPGMFPVQFRDAVMRFPMDKLREFSHEGLALSRPFATTKWHHLPPQKHRAVVVTSGGIDSITAAYVARKVDGIQDLTLFHANYGQLAATREYEAVRYAAGKLYAEVQYVEMPWLGAWGGSPLTDGRIVLPEGMRSAESTLCWVPGRNMVLLSVAAAYAEASGARYLYYGNNMEEEATGYSDNDFEFLDQMNCTFRYGLQQKVVLRTALARLMKPEILVLGDSLGVDYRRTWSCDRGGVRPCGTCGCCTTRRNAFIVAGLSDRQVYENDGFERYPVKAERPKLADIMEALCA